MTAAGVFVRTLRDISRTTWFIVTMIVVAFGPVAAALLSPVEAAGISVTITTPTNAERATSTAGNIVLEFVPTTAITNGSTITITWPATFTETPGALVDADVSVTGTNITSTTESFNSNVITSTLTTSGNVTTNVTITIGNTNQLQTPATAGNYNFSVSTSVGDNGAALMYVGDDNDVDVDGSVGSSLAFSIRNTADTADTNVCSLGAFTLVAVNTCSYRLKVTTNSVSGYQVQITSDGDLRLSGSGDVADALDIDLVGEATVTAGTEGYGIALNGGAATSGSITENGNFATDDSSVPFTPTNLYASDGPNAPATTDTTNTALVTHSGAIDGGTGPGTYSHRVTYYVTAGF